MSRGFVDTYSNAIQLFNSDSFDIKYPYILKNEQKFHHGW